MRSHPGRTILTLAAALLAGPAGLPAADATKPATVVAVRVTGTVEVQHGDATATEPVADGTQLTVADTVTTAARSSVLLVLPNGSTLAMRERSRLKITVAMHAADAVEVPPPDAADQPESGASQSGFELMFGQMLAKVRKLNQASTFEVRTPVSVAAVRGTVFEVAYDPAAAGEAQYRLSTSSGRVRVTPHGGAGIDVASSEQVDLAAEVGPGGVKVKRVKSGRLERQKRDQLERESSEHQRQAGDFARQANAAKAAAADRTAAKADAAAAKRVQAKDAAADKGRTVTKPTTTRKTPPRTTVPKRPPRRPGG